MEQEREHYPQENPSSARPSWLPSGRWLFIGAIIFLVCFSIMWMVKMRSATPAEESLYGRYFEPFPNNIAIDAAVQGGLAEALRNYEQGEYIAAIRQFNFLSQFMPSDTVQFFRSSSLLAVDQPMSAIPLLSKVLEAPNSIYRRPAYWYLALAHLRVERYAEALTMLDFLLLADSEDEYAQRAEALKRELESRETEM